MNYNVKVELVVPMLSFLSASRVIDAVMLITQLEKGSLTFISENARESKFTC